MISSPRVAAASSQNQIAAIKDLVVAFKANASLKRDMLSMTTLDKWMKRAIIYISCGQKATRYGV